MRLKSVDKHACASFLWDFLVIGIQFSCSCSFQFIFALSRLYCWVLTIFFVAVSHAICAKRFRFESLFYPFRLSVLILCLRAIFVGCSFGITFARVLFKRSWSFDTLPYIYFSYVFLCTALFSVHHFMLLQVLQMNDSKNCKCLYSFICFCFAPIWCTFDVHFHSCKMISQCVHLFFLRSLAIASSFWLDDFRPFVGAERVYDVRVMILFTFECFKWI